MADYNTAYYTDRLHCFNGTHRYVVMCYKSPIYEIRSRVNRRIF